MQLFNKNIKIHRGETFSLKFSIRTEDGAPYIISDEFTNPYFLLSISDSMYAEPKRFIKNYWLSLDNIPRFELTRPIDIKSIKYGTANTVSKYNTLGHIGDSFDEYGYISGYLNGEHVVIYPKFVFYNKDEGYAYWDGEKMVEYHLDFVKTFNSFDTESLVSQNYYYDLKFVSGIDTLTYLKSLAEAHVGNVNCESVEELYRILVDNNVVLPKDFDVTQPIGKIDVNYPLLSTGKIQVVNYLQGDL